MESLNCLFDVFSRERRRYALYVLDEAEEPMGLADLAAEVRRLESESDLDSTGRFEDVVLSLKHTHLPKAAEAEYIEYDREEDEIRISGEPAEFRIVLVVSEAIEHPGQARVFDPDSTTPELFLSNVVPTRGTGE